MKISIKSPLARRRLRFTAVLVGLLALVSASMLGWFESQRSWQDATGWNQLTERQRAAGRFDPATRVVRTSSAASIAIVPATASSIEGLEWLGHAGFVLRQDGTEILIDPNLNFHCSLARRQLRSPNLEETAAAPGTIDAILLSHAHMDHMDLPTLRRLRHKTGRIVVPQGAERYFEGEEWNRVEILPLAIESSVTVGDFEITAVPAAHNGNRLHPFESNILAVGYVVKVGESRGPSRTIYFAGDTARRNDFESIARSHAPDVAVLPIGAYAPRFPLADYHLSPEEAAEVAVLLGVDTVVPSHFGTFRLSLDHPASALPRFAAAAERLDVHWQLPRLIERDAEPPALLTSTQVASR